MHHRIPRRLVPLLLVAALPGCTTLPDTGRPLDRPSDLPWQGFGVEWDPVWWQNSSREAGYDSAGWKLALSRLDTLEAAPVRVMLHLRWFTQDAKLARWDWSSANAKSVFAHLDALKARGIPVLVCEWGWAGRRNSGEQIFARTSDSLYPVGIAKLLKELVVARGYTNIRWYSVGNEPESEMRLADGDGTWADLTLSVQKILDDSAVPLGRLATEEGITRGLVDDLSRRMLENAAIAGYHAYLDAGSLESAVLDRRIPERMPLWITETGMAGGSTFTHPDIDKPSFGIETISLGLAGMTRGASAMLYWCLHDGVYDFIPSSPMRWGMWTGPEERWRLRPWARAWALMAKAVPVGSMLSLPADLPHGVRAVWIDRPDGSQGFLVANLADDTLQLRFEPGRKGVWLRRFYDGTRDQGGGLLLPEESVTIADGIALPPRSAFSLRRRP